MLRSILAIAAVAVVSAGLTVPAAASSISPLNHYTPGQIKEFCGKTGGKSYSNDRGGYGCTASDDGSAVECNSEKCHKVVFNVRRGAGRGLDFGAARHR